jgi:hypothetical protein
VSDISFFPALLFPASNRSCCCSGLPDCLSTHARFVHREARVAVVRQACALLHLSHQCAKYRPPSLPCFVPANQNLLHLQKILTITVTPCVCSDSGHTVIHDSWATIVLSLKVYCWKNLVRFSAVRTFADLKQKESTV